jgi:hypothetical protein
MLLKADRNADVQLRARLVDGSVRLLRCAWLLSAESDASLGRSPTGDVIMKRRQELPHAAFFSPEEAAALLDRGDRSVLALTYRWLTADHPEPYGTTLAAVRSFLLTAQGADACGLFWECEHRKRTAGRHTRMARTTAALTLSSIFARAALRRLCRRM